MLTAVGWSHKGEYYKSWTSKSLTGFKDHGKLKIKLPAWASGAFGHGDVIQRDNQYWLYFQGTNTVGKIFQIGLARHPVHPIGLDDVNNSIPFPPYLPAPIALEAMSVRK
jgi:hypothetical protein